ncbi:MAG: tyrosine/phenylalanine carboxypeptidase domain-containing protein, partial [Pirellulales bacterium]
NDVVVHAEELVAAAREEIDFYHQLLSGFVAKVEIRNDLAASMMVAHDRLFVSATASLARRAIAPLLHHEIGTHLLTYFNGQQQPFQQLYAGLARYEELQEGLAVLAEYLVGGLTRSRLRAIACRVLAVQSMVDGRSFVATFHDLHHEHRQGAKAAFMTTLRVYRGGGLTKDAIYLRGLRDLVQYLAAGHDAEPLYVGKIALEHVPLVQELRRRGIVGPPALLPRFWDDAAAAQRLDRCRHSSLLELVEQNA